MVSFLLITFILVDTVTFAACIILPIVTLLYFVSSFSVNYIQRAARFSNCLFIFKCHCQPALWCKMPSRIVWDWLIYFSDLFNVYLYFSIIQCIYLGFIICFRSFLCRGAAILGYDNSVYHYYLFWFCRWWLIHQQLWV